MRKLRLLLPLVLGLLLCGCDSAVWQELLDRSIPPASVPAGRPADTPDQSAVSAANEAPAAIDTITIGSFNIQVFGQSKLKKPEVMDTLARIARRFDVLAIQEVRSKSQDVLPEFVSLVNADGSHYDFVHGERLGRTSSKEQYAFVYDAARLEVLPGTVYTVPDPEDRLHREPLVATFRVRGPPPSEAFSFTLINIHTDPDETDTELDALDDVYRYVCDHAPAEDDVILLGDLNVDADHLGQLGEVTGITWLIPASVPTNTRGNRSYDNILLRPSATVEYTGQSGVLDFRQIFQLSLDEALEVSDHLPVWATFSVLEGGGRVPVAERPVQPTR